MKTLTKYITKGKFKNFFKIKTFPFRKKVRYNARIALFHFNKTRVACLAIATLVCTCLAIARPYIVNMLAPEATATAAAKKQLPIYCVDTGTSKKIAISFDAAWGAGRLRRSFDL